MHPKSFTGYSPAFHSLSSNHFSCASFPELRTVRQHQFSFLVFFYLRDGLRRRAGFARTLGSPKHVWHLFRSIEWYGVFDTLVLLHKAKLLTTVSQRCMTWRSNVCACANVAMISTFKLSEPSCLTSYWQPYEPVSHGVLEEYNSLDKA